MELPGEVQAAINQAYGEMLADPLHTLLPKQRVPIYKATEILDEPFLTNFRAWLAILTARKVLPFWESKMPDDDLAQQILEVSEGLLVGKLTKEETAEDREYFYNAVGNSDDFVESSRAIAALDAAYSALKAVSGYAPFEEFSPQQIEEGYPDEIIAGPWCDGAGSAVLAYSGSAYDTDFLLEEINFNNELLSKLHQLPEEQLKNLMFSQLSDSVDNSGGILGEIQAFMKQSKEKEKENLSQLGQHPNEDFDPEVRKEFWKWWLFEAIPKAWDLAHQPLPK